MHYDFFSIPHGNEGLKLEWPLELNVGHSRQIHKAIAQLFVHLNINVLVDSLVPIM